MSTGALPVPSTVVKRTTERKEERKEREKKKEKREEGRKKKRKKNLIREEDRGKKERRVLWKSSLLHLYTVNDNSSRTFEKYNVNKKKKNFLKKQKKYLPSPVSITKNSSPSSPCLII